MYPPFGGLGPYGTYGNLGLYGALVAYGSLNLTESSPAQSWTEPFVAGDVKGWLGIELDDPSYDDQINALIGAAREQAEIEQNRDLVRKQWDLSLDYWPSYRVELRDPLISVDLVKYRDNNGNYTTLTEGADADYVVDTAKHPGVLAPPYNKSWPTFTPWPSSALLVRFTSGFAATSPWWNDAGTRIKLGMKMLITGWFQQRIPFVVGGSAAEEYPFAVTSCLRTGALVRAK